jgi:hypothetical protein
MFNAPMAKKSLKSQDDDYSQHSKYEQGRPDMR